MKLVSKPSPNQSARIHGQAAVRLIVCHTPEGSYESALATCLNPNADVSYHRLYRQDGREATQLVPFERKAWHAGALNSSSEGLSIAGYAWHFDLKAWAGIDEFAQGIAERLVARGLPCQWTTDPAKGGFCRHGDLQANRYDPTPDLVEWRIFVALVRHRYERLTKPWPKPIPKWFWAWLRWDQGVGEFKGHRRDRKLRPPAPRIIPPWAWRRRKAWLGAKKA